MQGETSKQHASDFLHSTPVTILLVVLAIYLFSIGWSGTAIEIAFLIVWDITNRIYFWRTRMERTSPARLTDFSLLHNRIFAALFCGLVIFQSYGLEYSWHRGTFALGDRPKVFHSAPQRTVAGVKTQSDQGAAWSYLKTVLWHLLEIVVSCGIWFLFLGSKGLLVGFGQYLAVHFGLFFRRVFASQQRV